MLPVLLAFAPPVLATWLRRRLGADIHEAARVSMFVVLNVQDLRLGPGVRIKPFVRISAQRVDLGADVSIGPGTSIIVHTLVMERSSSIATLAFVSGDRDQDRSRLDIGSHSRIFPLCWLDPDYGITLGSRVGVGGHGLIFTHGSWSNYFRGAPVAKGPVRIEDGAWLPWRVFVMPNVTIGAEAILGAGSVVTRSIPRRSLAGGLPAKVLRERAFSNLSREELRARVDEALAAYRLENPKVRALIASEFDDVIDARTEIFVTAGGDAPPALGPASVIDVVHERLVPGRNYQAAAHLSAWLTRYGVRADVIGP